VRWLSINAVTLEWEGRPATLNFLTDITERRRAEEEVHRALAKERELNELKSRFVAMTSHEFRTPLATILSSTELLDRHHDRLPAEERHAILRRIATGVDRMARMLDNVLTIGRAETEAMGFSPAPLDLPGLCRQLVDEARAGADRDMRFEFSGEQTTVEMDEKLLRHALGNLLSNAVKYSQPGSRVTFNVRVSGTEAAFEIGDEGIGIPQQDHERLYEAFHRARNVGNIAGTGLGLAIVKKSVELHGGGITFSSEIGRGTRFTVTLPLDNVNAAQR
jgi:signal transduction histidine kinase